MHFYTIIILFAMKFLTTTLECWPNFCPNPKSKNIIFGGTKGAFWGFSWGFDKLKPLPLESLRNFTQECWSNFCSSPKLKNSVFGVIKVN